MPPRALASLFGGKGEHLVCHGAAALDVPLPHGKQTCAPERLEAEPWVALRAGSKRRVEPAAAFAPVTARPPEMPDRGADPKRDVGASVLECVPKDGAEVVVLRFDPVVPDRRAPGQQLGACQLRKLEEEGAVPLPQDLSPAGLFDSLECELADRLQHPEALLCVADEALLDERLQRVEVGAADGFGRFERAAAGEHGEPREQAPLVGRQQVVAPFDRGAQRPLPRLGISSCLQKIEALREPLQDLAGSKDARAGGSELDRERQVVEPTAELRDRRRSP